ncbi:MAG: ABC transporter substrate-binding protein [Streptomycetaceae bacterium]|nr:ABC transporter substrate-binding protein [Streptomycetaceae bacterium]
MAYRSVVSALVLGLLATLGSVGCSGGDTDAAAAGPRTAKLAQLDPTPIAQRPTPALPVTVRGFDGAQVTVRDASRVIAVDRYGTLTQTVYALGLGDRLVGRTSTAAFPAVKALPNLGQGGSMSVEAVLAQHPSVLLTDSITTTPTMAEQLRGAGVTLVFFDPTRTMAGVGPQIQAVADALGVPAQGRALAERTNREIADAAKGPFPTPKLRIAFLYLRSTAITMMGGPGSGADSMIEALGGENVGTAAGLTTPFVPITSEAMIAARPDMFLVMSDGLGSVGGVTGLLQLPGVAQTPAGKAQRVVDMDDSVLLSFGPNTGHVLKALAAALYG